MAARTRTLIPLLLVLAAICGLALLRRAVDGPPPPARELFPYGELRVGVDASSPPFANDDAGTLSGLDIDLGSALGAELDLPVRFVSLGYDGLYDALKSDQVDALIASVVIDLTRLKDVHYSDAYFNAGLVLVSSEGLTQMTDLPGKRLAYEFGSEADTQARSWLRRILPFTPQPYELPRYALDAARLGAADAALVDAASARLYLREQPAWPAQLSYVTDVPYAVATQSRRPAISVAINAALERLAADGRLEQIIRRWL